MARLAIGWALTAEACFRHEPPTPAELERAIEVVEDELMRTRAAGASGALLHADGEALREVAQAIGGDEASVSIASGQQHRKFAISNAAMRDAMHATSGATRQRMVRLYVGKQCRRQQGPARHR